MNKLEQKMFDAIQRVPLINLESDDYEGYAKECAKVAIELAGEAHEDGTFSNIFTHKFDFTKWLKDKI